MQYSKNNRLPDCEIRIYDRLPKAAMITKFIIIPVQDVEIAAILVIVEVCTIILAFVSEKADMSIFHSLYKTKTYLMKCRHFLTNYLPNQIAILSKDCTSILFSNSASNRFSRCDTIAKTNFSLEGLVIEEESVRKNQPVLDRLGYIRPPNDIPLNLCTFLELLSKNIEVVKEADYISVKVFEDEINEEKGHIQNSDEMFKSLLQRKAKSSELLIKEPVRDLPYKKHNLKSILASIRNTFVAKEHKIQMPNDLAEVNLTPIFRKEKKQDSKLGSSHKRSGFKKSSEGCMKRYYNVKIFILPWDDNEEAVGLVFNDITYKRAITDLKIKDKSQDLVIAMVSHELRTPLNGMLGLLEIIRKMSNKDPEINQYVDSCRSNGMLLLNLVNSILDLAQINNKKLRLISEKVNVQQLITEISSLFSYYSIIKGIYLRIEIAPDVPKIIITDKNRLSQVLINLIGNAYKFTFQGGITIRVEVKEINKNKLRFSVEDTGIGISDEDQTRLFKMLGKVEQKDGRINTSGVGLGLTISYSLIMALNSTKKNKLCLASQRGQGSAFSFSLKYESPAIPKSSPKQQSQIVEYSDDEGNLSNADER